MNAACIKFWDPIQPALHPYFKKRSGQMTSTPLLHRPPTASSFMPPTIFDVPPEVFHKIALFATLASPLGPPKELFNCMLVCRTFMERLLPRNASQLYYIIFAQKFDARGPIYRLTSQVVHEHAPLEMRRRFSAIQIFKRNMFDHPDLTEALWIAYLMVEDSDTSQKNVKQLLRVHTPKFLDSYLRSRMYHGASDNNGWPIMDENMSLAIALSWTLASQRVMSYENSDLRVEMMNMLKPIIFASFRYSIFFTPVDHFTFGGNSPQISPVARGTPPPYPLSSLPPQEIAYFGAVKRKARPPLAALFASLLYFVRVEARTRLCIPSHIRCETREQAHQLGIEGPCVDDIKHFYHQCRTRFADFPGIDVGIQSSSIATMPDTILCQPSFYKLGTLTGQWQGSTLLPGFSGLSTDEWSSDLENSYTDSRKPLYLTIEEHYCSDIRSVVPMDLDENGVKNAWLPEGLIGQETAEGMMFTDKTGTFQTTYETYGRDHERSRNGQRPVVDIIITAKTEDQYMVAWGGYTTIVGRIRLYDGLMVLIRSNPDGREPMGEQILRGYVTSSQNLVGRMTLKNPLATAIPPFSCDGVFSLSKNHMGGGPSREQNRFM